MGLFRHNRGRQRINFFVLSVLMLVAGVVLTFLSLRSQGYQQTEGKIIESDVTGTGKSRKVVIRYGYTVNGTYFDNDTVSYSLNMFRENELLNKYRPGQTVAVYYSITDPSYSVLEKGFSFGALLLTIAGAGLFMTALRMGT